MKLLLLSLVAGAALLPAFASAASPDLYSIPVQNIDGQPTSLKPYAGKVLLIVNTASKCGFTPQYEGLEALYRKYKGQGLEVLGFPANEFGGQEPGSNAEIKTFCTSNYQVSFPMFSKIHVKGPETHPLFKDLTTATAAPGWNFNKYLISRDGRILAHYDSETEPQSDTLTKAIETALAAK
jgi:glutathione peroxidase